MNGIDPPTPMSTGSVPSQASVNAARAASYAGPVASICVASPVSTDGDGELGAPRDVLPRGAGAGSRGRSAVVSPGAIRIEILARAAGTRVLLAPSTLGASRPVMLSEGLVHSRSTTGPSPIHSTPGLAPDSARSRSSGYSTSAAGPLCRPSTATLPSSSCRRRDQPAQGHQRVGDQAAPHAGVDGVGEGADLDVDPDQAAQAGGEGGLADVPVAGVGDDDDVGGAGAPGAP